MRGRVSRAQVFGGNRGQVLAWCSVPVAPAAPLLLPRSVAAGAARAAHARTGRATPATSLNLPFTCACAD
ncbi:hypothetical protein JYU34_000012 [Plutella xylostella]|uniref:Uncharacterized protein n=1 Tax=Plutella xylostella TaxID=51655 RepID=A0ABQ7R6M4_PLUXY|nr:hypothetical protein JYU34_000012 [Plutella xylostella]